MSSNSETPSRLAPSSATTVSTGRAFPTDAATSALLEAYTIIGKVRPFPTNPQVLSIAQAMYQLIHIGFD
jgi:hypothetical protein